MYYYFFSLMTGQIVVEIMYSLQQTDVIEGHLYPIGEYEERLKTIFADYNRLLTLKRQQHN